MIQHDAMPLQASSHALRSSVNAGAEELDGAAVIPSLEYLRDRVGVPRDLDLPAARQLRAHLNWAADLLAV
jgi:glutathione S-transferase